MEHFDKKFLHQSTHWPLKREKNMFSRSRKNLHTRSRPLPVTWHDRKLYISTHNNWYTYSVSNFHRPTTTINGCLLWEVPLYTSASKSVKSPKVYNEKFWQKNSFCTNRLTDLWNVQKTRFSNLKFSTLFLSGTTQLGAIKLGRLMGHGDLTRTFEYEQIRFIRSEIISQSPKSFDPL
jgi:hypothetical protein